MGGTVDTVIAPQCVPSHHTPDPSWIEMGNRLPIDRPRIPPYEVQVIEAYERSTTKLAMETTHADAVIAQTVRYECAHRRVEAVLHSVAHPLDDGTLARLVLSLHAWEGGCQCFRADWDARLGAPADRDTLEREQVFAHTLVREHPACRVHYAVRRVPEPTWDTDLDGEPW